MKGLEEIYNKINNLTYLLERKIEILNIVLNITKNQNIFFNENSNVDNFINMSLEEKQNLINELINIDEMFFSIFSSFKGALNDNKKIFQKEIKLIQDKITKIADVDFKIRLQEEKNKQILNNSNILNQEKLKTLKISKDKMLKKYENNNKKVDY